MLASVAQWVEQSTEDLKGLLPWALIQRFFATISPIFHKINNYLLVPFVIPLNMFLNSCFQHLIEVGRKRFWNNFLKLGKFFECMERQPKLVSGKDSSHTLMGKIEFNQVSFHYPVRPDSKVLQVCGRKS